MPTQLYRHWDKEGRLLYVGVTDRPKERISAHRSRSPWGKDIASVSTEDFEDRASALAAEGKAIRDESPLHNLYVPPEGTSEIAAYHVDLRKKTREGYVSIRLGKVRKDEDNAAYWVPAAVAERVRRMCERATETKEKTDGA